MLICGQCGYELTGLVKGPEAVVCPECGGRTEHVDGRNLPPRPSWRMLGRWRWLVVTAPALTSLATVVLASGADPKDPWGAILALSMGLLVVGAIWLIAMGCVASELRLHPGSGGERVRIIAGMGLVSAALAFAVLVGMARWLM